VLAHCSKHTAIPLLLYLCYSFPHVLLRIKLHDLRRLIKLLVQSSIKAKERTLIQGTAKISAVQCPPRDWLGAEKLVSPPPAGPECSGGRISEWANFNIIYVGKRLGENNERWTRK
jgi:hypothetical protein